MLQAPLLMHAMSLVPVGVGAKPSSLGVLLEPEDSCLGCGQLALWLMQPNIPPPSLLFSLPDPAPPRPQEPFSNLGKSYYLCIGISSTGPLTTAFQPLCKASKVPQQRHSEHKGQKESLVISASLPATSLLETRSMEAATCWARREGNEKIQGDKKNVSEYCWLSIYPDPGQESDQAAGKHRTPPTLPYPGGCLQPLVPSQSPAGE